MRHTVPTRDTASNAYPSAEDLQTFGLLSLEPFRLTLQCFMVRLWCLVVSGTAVAAEKSKIQEWPSAAFWRSTVESVSIMLSRDG